MAREHPLPMVTTVKELYGMAVRCAAPTCSEPLYRRSADGQVLLLNSQVCHIAARRSGGPRWEETMTALENAGDVPIDAVSAEQLTARGWVSTGTGTVCHDWLLHMFAQSGQRPDIVAEVPDFTLHLELARQGLALALVPRMGRAPLHEELTTLVLRDAPARIVSVAHRSNQDDDPAITLLREALLSALH